MIINKEKILKNPRLCKAMFGMTKEEIEALLPVFGRCLIIHRYEIKPNRKRKVGGGQKGDLPTDEEKLLFILMYLKVYPTHDVFSVLSDHQRSKCGDSIKLLLPVLQKTLGRHLTLPIRKANSLKEVFERCPGLKDVFLDGSERRTQKPTSKKRRNKLYSGKKKATARKNLVLSDEKKNILFLSPTKSGRRHDKRLADKADIAMALPNHVTVWTDTGFQGFDYLHPNTVMPKKATKNNPLTFEQKQNNRIISGIRVLSEHAIAGYKRFKAASDVYRNRLPNMDDMLTLVAAGLWNFHLKQTI